MKNFIENHKKGIGIFFIFIAVIFMAFYFLIAAYKKAQIPPETLRTPEEIQKLESDTGNDTIPDQNEKDAEKEWDGESVGLDFEPVDLGNCDLNQEVRNLIDDSVAELSEEMQWWLYADYGIENVTKVVWNQIATIDYEGKNILLQYHVVASQKCNIKCMYSQKDKTWSFYKFRGQGDD